MTTKIVVRLLNEHSQMLGWVEHWAAVRGDGCLRASWPVVVPFTGAGRVVEVSLHWCDVNTETRVPVPSGPFATHGGSMTVFAPDAAMIKVGDMPGPLPAVTVGSVAVGIPVGAMGTKGAA